MFESPCFYTCSKKGPSTSETEATQNTLLTSFFRPFVDLIGLPWVCFAYAIMSVAALVFVTVFIPETKGCSLEQISMELAKA